MEQDDTESDNQTEAAAVSSYIPELTNNDEVYPTSSLPQLRATFESARFWFRCAENACQKAASFDHAVGQNFHKAVREGMNQFLIAVKDASQKCIDEATRYVPDLTLNPASLLPPLNDDNQEDGGETFDVKPDRKCLEQAMLPNPVSIADSKTGVLAAGNAANGPGGQPGGGDDGADDGADMTYDGADDDADFKYTVSRSKGRKRGRWRRIRDDDPIQCSDCDIDFANREDLQSHVEIAHPEKSSLSCPHCSKVYTTPRAVKKHINDVHNKRKVCNVCGKKYAYQYELDNHAKRHAEKAVKGEDSVKTFACQICGYNATRMHHVKSHVRFKHAEWLESGAEVMSFLEEVAREEEPKEEAENPEDNVGDFSCMICNRNFRTKKILNKHLKTHLGEDAGVGEDGTKNKLKCTKCRKQCATKEALFAHIKRVHSKSLKCKFCHKTFFAKYQLEGHLRVHLNLKPFRCDACATKAFPSLTALRIHTRLKHPERYNAKPYRCLKCDVTFTFKAQLDQHNNRQHSSSEPLPSYPLPTQPAEKAEEDENAALDPSLPVAVSVKVEKVDDDKRQCKKCGRSFSSDRLLWQHIRRVHNKKFTCRTCGKKFGYPGELKDHEMFHTDRNAYSCDFCDKTSHTRALIVQHAKFNHPDEMNESRFACDACDATFPLSVSLSHHAKIHAPQSTQTFSCDLCLTVFPTQLRLKTHKMVAHDNDASDAETKASQMPIRAAHDPLGELREPQDPVMCTKCGLEFPTMDALSRHKTIEHKNDPKLQCPACDKICSNKEALRNHKRRVHSKKRECSICNKKFPFKYVLDAHMLTHTGERNFTCMHCKKTFYTIQQLNVHIRLVHSQRSFHCELCSAKFGTKQGKDRHVQHRHTNDRPQTCEYCGKGFVDRRSLKAHIFIHTRQSDIKCDACGKLFGTRSCLNKHIRIKHKGERKLCPICGKHIAGSIGMHLKSHGEKRYKCDQCEKIYAWPQGLKEHLRTHSGDKPYECKVCNKRFLGSANFSKHKKIHVKDEGTRRRAVSVPEKVEKPSFVEKKEQVHDFHDQYQAVMNQSLNQLMMNQSMLNPSMVNQSVINQSVINQSMINQSMISQSMMMHNHGELNPPNMHWQMQ